MAGADHNTARAPPANNIIDPAQSATCDAASALGDTPKPDRAHRGRETIALERHGRQRTIERVARTASPGTPRDHPLMDTADAKTSRHGWWPTFPSCRRRSPSSTYLHHTNRSRIMASPADHDANTDNTTCALLGRLLSLARNRPSPANERGVLRQAAAFTSIFFGSAFALAVFGKVTVSTPLANSAAILSGSTSSGSAKLRRNAP